MKKLTVSTGRPYAIYIERGILKDAGRYIRTISQAQRAAIITDSNVSPLYTNCILNSLKNAGFDTSEFVFPAGETSKRLSTIEQIYTHLITHSFTRSDVVVALGGGVTGDMAGFAAATYQRGIDFVQLPTTLLAQIDSSVGGKTGVDLPQGKNLVGAFWQPRLVLIDPDTLSTLPPRYFSDGMAEAIKYGCIKSRSLFTRICTQNAVDFMEDLIYECVDIKRIVVEHDEKEKGERMLLNFGHTLGHALEKLYQYGTLSHGEAVGIGMVLLTQASEKAGLTVPGTTQQITRALQKYNLPYSDSTSLEEIAHAALTDKKSAGSSISLILLKDIGSSFIYPVAHSDLYRFIAGGSRI